MLETFKARLKAKSTAAGANLSTVRIDALADRLNKRFPDFKEEKEHDDKLDELYDPADYKEFAALDDHQRAKSAKEKAEKEKADKDKAEKEAAEKLASTKPGDEEPAWFKKYREDTDAKISAIEKEKTQGSIKSKLAEKLKDVPEKFWRKWTLPEKEEDIDAFVSDVQTDYTEFETGKSTEKNNQNLGLNHTPKNGSSSDKSKGKASDKEVEEVVKNIM